MDHRQVFEILNEGRSPRHIAETPDEFLERCMHLKLDKALHGIKPYKALLLGAVVILIAKRKIDTRQVFLDGGLVSAFRQLLHRYFPGRFPRADARYPYRHLANDGIWRLVPHPDMKKELIALLASSAKARQIAAKMLCVEIDDSVFQAITQDASFRRAIYATLRSLNPEWHHLDFEYFDGEATWSLGNDPAWAEAVDHFDLRVDEREGIIRSKEEIRLLSSEYKTKPIETARASGKNIDQIAKLLVIAETFRRKRVTAPQCENTAAALASKKPEKLGRLRKEVHLPRMERNFLRKGATFFAKYNA